MKEQDVPPSAGARTELVNELYATIVDPGRYDELVAAWDRHLSWAIGKIDGKADLRAGVDDEIEQHFQQAFTLVERLGRPKSLNVSIEAAVEADPVPSLLISRDGKIVTVNRPARELFDIGAGETIADLHMAPEGIRQVRSAISRLEAAPVGQLLTIARLFSSQDGSTFFVALCRAITPENVPPLALLTLAELVWTDHMNDLVRNAFNLSEAERAVLQALIAGKSIAQIARARKTSVETVRTQTRAVLRKTETRSQAELMRLLAVLAQFCARHGNRNGSGWQNSESRFARLSVRERSLAFAQFGDTKGRPVLFVHGMIDGCSAPLFNESRLKDRNIRLIVPARPGYGASDPATSAEIAGFFAEDMRLLLDHLGVEHCTILGHFGGALYAYAVAGTNAERVRAVINVAGTVPITSLAQVAAFGPRQRIIAYTSRFAPAISRLILRAGVALLDSGGHRAFMSALYEKSVLDRAVAERADVYPFLADGYHFSAAQGHGAFEADAVRTISDWSELVNKVSVPVRLVHGRHDPAMPISLVREFAARRGNVELCEIGDAGQLVFFSHPDRVFDILEDVLSDRRIASVPR